MTEKTSFTMRIKEVSQHETWESGFYWTLDDLPEDQCCWSGPETSAADAKQAAVNSIVSGYAEAAKNILEGN